MLVEHAGTSGTALALGEEGKEKRTRESTIVKCISSAQVEDLTIPY
jgi:hypothetical protein